MKKYLDAVLRRLVAAMEGAPADFAPELTIPADKSHGDLATNSAFRLARHLRKNPRDIARDMVSRLSDDLLDPGKIASCEVAGAGFINFRFSSAYLHRKLETLLKEGEAFGRSRTHAGRKALVEFVSANPTGPLTIGHGRNAVLGDTIANLLEWTGFDVTREYYFNDAGRQMRALGASVRARYAEILAEGTDAEPRYPFPEDGYEGTYIIDIARALVRDRGSALLAESGLAPFVAAAEEAIFADIKRTLRRLGIGMDAYFNERTLYNSGAIEDVLEALDEYLYRQDDAVWFRTSALGKDKDTVLVKSTGEPTYRLPDIAYHLDKYARDFDVMINVFGADHIATYPDIVRALGVLGHDTRRLEVIIYQFVTLVRGGREVKMSTRKARFVTLDELLDEVGEDVSRYFFLMRSAGRHLEFDMDLAREASDKNPVFYLQYAHARICSILKKAREVGFEFSSDYNASSLGAEPELQLIKELIRFPEALAQIAAAREPHRLGTYLRGVAEAFTRFYHECRIIGEERDLATARMALSQATRIVLRNGLAVLGLTAPEQM